MHAHQRPNRRSYVGILAMVLCLFMVVNVPAGLFMDLQLVHAQPSRSITACSGSEPPPPDLGGERWGDWVIDCPVDEPVVLVDENFKIHGNVTVVSGMLDLTMSTKLKQMFSSSERYTFEVRGQASLNVEKKAELHADSFLARPTSDIVFNNAKLTASGNINISTGILDLRDSYLINQAFNGRSGSHGKDADLVLDAQTAVFTGSTILSYGGRGGDGTQDIPGGKGGDSHAIIHVTAGVLNDVHLNISAGKGGDGMISMTGNGSSGGMGGSSSVVIRAPLQYNMLIEGSNIFVVGGEGGKGGSGGLGQGEAEGGDGGRGENGGDSDLSILGDQITIEGSEVLVMGGDGAQGGTGGEAPHSVGGNGGVSGRGANAYLHLESYDDLTITGSSIMVVGGNGADGGFFGWGGEGHGDAGDGGTGGSSSLIMDIVGDVISTDATVLAKGNTGGQGGLGAPLGANGGDGGSAYFEVSSTGRFDLRGPTDGTVSVGSMGLDGGWGGDAVGGEGNGGGLRGLGGDGGDSTTIIRAPEDIVLLNVHLRATKTVGGQGGKDGQPGDARIFLDTTFFNSTDCTIDWTPEGFDDEDKGVLRNSTVSGPERAMVEPGTDAMVWVWSYLTVTIPGATSSQTWEIEVFKGNMSDGLLLDSSSKAGPRPSETFFLLGETIDQYGPTAECYSIFAHVPGSFEETDVVSVCPTESQEVILVPTDNYYAPNIFISFPEDNSVIRTNKLAPCRAPTEEEQAAGLEPPGCLLIEGEAWEDERDRDRPIEDVMVTAHHEDQGTIIWSSTTDPSVVLKDQDTGRIRWYFEWEVEEFDIEQNDYVWYPGEWCITVKAFDGVYWSDDLYRSGEKVKIKLHVQQVPATPPSVYVDAGSPEKHDFEYFESGVNVTFDDANVQIVGSLTVLRMEWDYDGDGNVDWSFIPSDCTDGSTCAPPATTHIYSKEGFYNARFCAIDEYGVRNCDAKKILVEKNPAPTTTFGVPREFITLISVLIICISSVITVALLIGAMTEATKYAIMGFILIPLYSRLKKEEMLDNYTRGEIRGYIVANPGAHYSRIKRDLTLNNGTLIYHLRTLEREGFIYSHRDDYYRRFYPRGRKPRPGPHLTTVQDSIIEALLMDPSMTAAQLAKKLEKSRKVVNYHLVWLRRWGLIEAKKDGRKKIYSVIYEDEVEMEQDSPKAKGDVK